MAPALVFVPVAGCDTHWPNFTLIVPSVAVGNVPQLSVDILINTLIRDGEVELVGRIVSPGFRPIAGPNAFRTFSPDPSSSCQVFASRVRKIVIIQIRSLPFAGATDLLVEHLQQWICNRAFATVIVLSSSFAQYLTDPDLHSSGNTIRYFLSRTALSLEARLTNMKIESPAIAVSARDEQNEVVTAAAPPGTGFGFKLFQQLYKRDIKSVLLISFCSEGDNRPEAVNLFEFLASSLLQLDCEACEEPVSWRNMFGNTSYSSDIF